MNRTLNVRARIAAMVSTVVFTAMTLLPLAASGASLERHSVLADGHPMALWEKRAPRATQAILLVHGRTWSALPDFDLQARTCH